MKRLFLITALILGTSLTGLAHNDPPASPANKICPVLPDEPIDPQIYADYEGRRVWFCCARCRKQFLEEPDAYLANLPQLGATGTGGEHTSDVSDEPHDHATDHGQPEGINRLIRFTGKFHPLVVHFPIALIIAAALAEVLSFIVPKPLFGHAARFSILFGALSSVLTVGLGWAAGAFAGYPGELAGVLSIHRWLGTFAGVSIIVAAVFSEGYHRSGNRRWGVFYRLALLSSVIAVGLTGHFGGTLIHGLEHYTW